MFAIMFAVLIAGTCSHPMTRQLRTEVTERQGDLSDTVFMEEVHNDIVGALQDESLGQPSFIVGLAVKQWRPGSGANPEELGTYTQGDILTVKDENDRSGVSNVSFRWPNATVLYKIADNNFTTLERTQILNAFEEFHRKTCIKFKPYSEKEGFDYIEIQNGVSGCWSSIGRVGGKQVINLQAPACLFPIGSTLHELMHAIGFYHEQSRKDRDDFVTIMWDNILEPRNITEKNFREQASNSFGIAYDYRSLMHYSAYAFSKNHLRTIVTKKEGQRIGQRVEFSELDIKKIKTMYKCKGKISEL